MTGEPVADDLLAWHRMAKGGDNAVLAQLERRIAAEVDAAIATRSPDEGRLAAIVRVMAPFSVALRNHLAGWVKELVRLEDWTRELYAAGLRSLVECEDKRGAGLLSAALKTEEFGGVTALSVACFAKDASLMPALARAATSSRTLTAFAAEVARICHGEHTGPRLFGLAPRIKESNRISLVSDLLLPVACRGVDAKICAGLADALNVLCGSERHLGRWLVMAEIAHRGGDPRPMKEATLRTTTGPDSARAGWSLCAWALSPANGHKGVRPTTELVARLSHRPSADRDASFLFRMAEHAVPEAKPMLEALVRARPLGDEIAVRAATELVRRYGRPSYAAEAIEASRVSSSEALRALSAACLWELGEHERAVADATELVDSEDLTALAWSSLVLLASRAKEPMTVLSGSNFRRVQCGWSE
jgi:hypothetical protein